MDITAIAPITTQIRQTPKIGRIAASVMRLPAMGHTASDGHNVAIPAKSDKDDKNGQKTLPRLTGPKAQVVRYWAIGPMWYVWMPSGRTRSYGTKL